MQRDEELERIAGIAVDCGYALHRDLGPGLLESAYERLMFAGLRQRGLQVERQVPVRIEYNGIVIDDAFKADLVVEGRLLVELKSVEIYSPVHAKQVITYLRLMRLPLGLLINFGMASYKEGVRRLGNDYFSPPQA